MLEKDLNNLNIDEESFPPKSNLHNIRRRLHTWLTNGKSDKKPGKSTVGTKRKRTATMEQS